MRATSRKEIARAALLEVAVVRDQTRVQGISATSAVRAQTPSPTRQLPKACEIGTVSTNAEVRPMARAVV